MYVNNIHNICKQLKINVTQNMTAHIYMLIIYSENTKKKYLNLQIKANKKCK